MWKGKHWWRERSLAEKIGLGIGALILGVGLFALYGWVVMQLWNWLMPSLFHLGTMDFWQALGLPVLLMLLFMGVGGGGDRKDRRRKRELRQSLRTDEEPTAP